MANKEDSTQIRKKLYGNILLNASKETWKFLLTEGISVYFLVFIFKHQSWVQLSECIYPDCYFVKNGGTVLNFKTMKHVKPLGALQHFANPPFKLQFEIPLHIIKWGVN